MQLNTMYSLLLTCFWPLLAMEFLRANDINEYIDDFNRKADSFLTGLLVQMKDGVFRIGPKYDAPELNCREGFIRPFVLDRIEAYSSEIHGKVAIKVIMKHISLFYKTCHITRPSQDFPGADVSSPCYLTVDIEQLFGAVAQGGCENEFKLDLSEDPSASGFERVFALQNATVYTVPLRLENWRTKLVDAVRELSHLFVLPGYECLKPITPIMPIKPEKNTTTS